LYYIVIGVFAETFKVFEFPLPQYLDLVGMNGVEVSHQGGPSQGGFFAF
jgi:hypothetical protein